MHAHVAVFFSFDFLNPGRLQENLDTPEANQHLERNVVKRRKQR